MKSWEEGFSGICSFSSLLESVSSVLCQVGKNRAWKKQVSSSVAKVP